MNKTEALALTTQESLTIVSDMLKQGEGFFTSMPQSTDDEAVTLFNASSTSGLRIKDMINKPFLVENIILESVPMTNEKTGTVEMQVRTILISPDGTTYGCMSRGVFNSIIRVMRMERFGMAPWKPALKFEAYMTSASGGDVLSIRLLGRDK